MTPSPAAGSIAIVLGTRPEIIKLAHLIRILGDRATVIHTGQHFDASLSAIFFDTFGLREPAVRLGIGGTSRGTQIGRAVDALDAVFASTRPATVIVQGDTNSTLAGALAANSRGLPLIHVEAGLRSFDRRMPEEHNRVAADHLADLCCAPTAVNRDNLLAERVPAERITLTGNTIVEAVASLLPDAERRHHLASAHGVRTDAFILGTFHRPENVDDPQRLAAILDALQTLPLPVLLPVHPRTLAAMERGGLSPGGNVRVIAPLGYPEFLGLAAVAALLVSDSGGIQEEASIVKRPVVVVRRSTERPEVVGTFATLAEPEAIRTVVEGWLSDLAAHHARLAATPSPYGDGRASERIAELAMGLAPS
jgi:UDP-N-acetylglucosamine 2-epimerase (non-hydrolysing)